MCTVIAHAQLKLNTYLELLLTWIAYCILTHRFNGRFPGKHGLASCLLDSHSALSRLPGIEAVSEHISDVREGYENCY